MKKHEEPITLKQASNHLKVSESTVRRLLANNNIPARKPMGRWIFYISELDDWVEESKNDKRR